MRRPFLLLPILFCLAACVRQSPETAVPLTATAPAAEATLTIQATGTPTATPDPPTPTPTTPPVHIADLLAVPVPEQEDHPFVLLVDPYTWQAFEPADCATCPRLTLQHWYQPGCSLQIFPQETIAAEAAGPLDLGGRVWQTESSLQGNRIHYASIWSDQFRLDALADGILDPTCRADVEEALGGVRLTWEALAMRLPPGVPTPVPQPLPELYSCGSLPPRLTIGATAQVVADSIWVRSEPRRAADTQILLLYKDLAVALIVNSGPVCAEGLTFWNVRYYAGAEFSGWIAESDSEEYFLEPLTP